jgi:outer membrane protein assembly factor BamE (lipoprotein component of BamABCDE complex)
LLYQLRLIKHFHSLDSISKTFNLKFHFIKKKNAKKFFHAKPKKKKKKKKKKNEKAQQRETIRPVFQILLR